MKWLAATTSTIAVSVAAVVVCSSAGGSASAQESTRSPPSLSEACPVARAAPLSPQALFACFSKANLRVSRAAQHIITFETRDDADPQTALSFVDAVAVTGDALVEIVDRPGGKSALARINTVSVAIGAAPSANLAGGVLTVTIVPLIGTAGLPSIQQIEKAALTYCQS